jgi:hypothetical protein
MAASLLEESFDEEKETDQKLTTIAESHINRPAADQGEKRGDVRRASGAESDARGGRSTGRRSRRSRRS